MGTKLAARALEYLITQIKEHVNQDTGENKATSPDTATLLGLQVRSACLRIGCLRIGMSISLRMRHQYGCAQAHVLLAHTLILLRKCPPW